MGGKSRKRTASLVSVAARKKACSQNVNNASIDSNTVNDSTDSEGESYLDLASARSKDEQLASCQRRLLEMEKLVNELKCCIGQQNIQIETMHNKVNFLLSAMGLAEDGPTTGAQGPAQDAVDSGVGEPSGSDIGSVKPGLAAPGTMSYAQAANKFRTAVVAAVHIEHKSIQSRGRNFVISGLNPIDNMDDSKLIHRFLAEILGLTVTVTSCKRIGKSTVEFPQRLLVTLGTVDQAASVINAARKLRLSNNPEISGKIYINPDLTVAERKAAYELRCKHRLAKQKRINHDPSVRSLAASRSGHDDDIFPALPSRLEPNDLLQSRPVLSRADGTGVRLREYALHGTIIHPTESVHPVDTRHPVTVSPWSGAGVHPVDGTHSGRPTDAQLDNSVHPFDNNKDSGAHPIDSDSGHSVIVSRLSADAPAFDYVSGGQSVVAENERRP